MPLPDASKKSPRVYTLLQNTDLDSVTFANIQAVGNPIAIEEANEDEMRRLVLVNLCRLVTSGEWTGLLDAGGGGGGSDKWSMGLPTSSFEYSVGSYSGGVRPDGKTYVDDTLYLSPFSLAEDATITTARYHISTIPSSTNVTIAIYETDSDTGCPSALLDYNSTAQTTIGEKQITFASSISLSANTLYWIGLSHDNASDLGVIGTVTYTNQGFLPVIDTQAIDGNLNPLVVGYSYTWASSPPDPLTKASLTTDGQSQSSYIPMIRLGV